jgi:hypothetical protein
MKVPPSAKAPPNTLHSGDNLDIEAPLGKKIDIPAQQDIRSFNQAPKAKGKKAENLNLF